MNQEPRFAKTNRTGRFWQNTGLSISPTDLIELLSRAADRAIPFNKLELLMQHLLYLIEENKTHNLTTIRTIRDGLITHVEDSLTTLPELEQAPAGTLADLGSGTGYPGIPLALISERPTTLIEATQKKANFLCSVVSQTGLDDLISVEAQRIEVVAIQNRETFQAVTARALSELSVLIELAVPLLAQNGLLIAYKGIPSQQE
jgi:16S rRNA (guanine527-N7)-methyltransferase